VSLAFLTPDAVGEVVAARSPMERLARAAGAQVELRDGWNVAARFGDAARERALLAEGVAFADRCQMFKLELQASPDALAEIVAAASGGAVLEPGRAAHAGGAWWCPVTPERVLVLGEPGDGGLVRAAVAEATSGPSTTVTAVDVTSGLAALTLAGPEAGELLARFCAIDARPAVMPVGAFRPGSVARTPGYVLRDRDERLLVLVGWALGHYLWTVVADAAEHLGGGPVGVDALSAASA
jgi:heterotetrameric sarcosine oxidase gamma subunit